MNIIELIYKSNNWFVQEFLNISFYEKLHRWMFVILYNILWINTNDIQILNYTIFTVYIFCKIYTKIKIWQTNIYDNIFVNICKIIVIVDVELKYYLNILYNFWI